MLNIKFNTDILQNYQAKTQIKVLSNDVSVSYDDSSSFLKTSEDCTADFLKGIASSNEIVSLFPFRMKVQMNYLCIDNRYDAMSR